MRDLHVTIPAGALRWFLVGILAAFVGELSSENVTLTTYYPAPSGVYKNLVTTEATSLARQSGTVTVGENAAAGTLKLDINGALRVGSSTWPPPTSLSASAAGAGAIIYDSANARFMGSDGANWAPLNPAAGGPIICSASRSWVNSTHQNYVIKFTPAECGGTLPNGTYIGVAKTAQMCNGLEHFKVLDEGETSAGYPGNAAQRTGPAVALYPNGNASGPCQWPGSPYSMTATAVYFKK